MSRDLVAFGLLLVAGAACAVGCMPPGSLSVKIATETGQPLGAAHVVLDFGDGATFEQTVQDGQYWTAWSHGSWRGAVVKASAPGRQEAQATIGWDSWNCDFQLAPEGAPPGSSRAQCTKGDRQ